MDQSPLPSEIHKDRLRNVVARNVCGCSGNVCRWALYCNRALDAEILQQHQTARPLGSIPPASYRPSLRAAFPRFQRKRQGQKTAKTRKHQSISCPPSPVTNFPCCPPPLRRLRRNVEIVKRTSKYHPGVCLRIKSNKPKFAYLYATASDALIGSNRSKYLDLSPSCLRVPFTSQIQPSRAF